MIGLKITSQKRKKQKNFLANNMNKDNKEKLKNLPSSSMEELFQRGEVGEFDHLKDISEMKKDGDRTIKSR